MNLIKKIIKDVCTVSNGEDYCIAGIFGLVGLIIGCLVAIGALYASKSYSLTDIGDFLVKFGAYLGTLISTVCAGKAVKKGAEPQ